MGSRIQNSEASTCFATICLYMLSVLRRDAGSLVHCFMCFSIFQSFTNVLWFSFRVSFGTGIGGRTRLERLSEQYE